MWDTSPTCPNRFWAAVTAFARFGQVGDVSHEGAAVTNVGHVADLSESVLGSGDCFWPLRTSRRRVPRGRGCDQCGTRRRLVRIGSGQRRLLLAASDKSETCPTRARL